MTRMTALDCAVVCNLINTHTGNGNGKEDRIGESGGGAKKRKKSHSSCRRHVGKGGDLGGNRKKRRK